MDTFLFCETRILVDSSWASLLLHDCITFSAPSSTLMKLVSPLVTFCKLPSRKTEVVVHPREIYITRLKHFSFKVGLLPAIWNISDLLYITFLKHQDFPGSLETVPIKDILTNPAFSYGQDSWKIPCYPTNLFLLTCTFSVKMIKNYKENNLFHILHIMHKNVIYFTFQI